uniref:WKF domain-containing protein n=1 Tax=Gopherus agassizii TaxID=38772 RepID=A0A452I1D1_9SAUR
MGPQHSGTGLYPPVPFYPPFPPTFPIPLQGPLSQESPHAGGKGDATSGAEYFYYPVFYLSNYFSHLFCYSWSKKTKEWKFQKTRQTWLLLHMYEKEKVPDEYFSILLDYLEGLKGSARDVTMQKAEALMKEYDNSDTEDPGLLEKCERIRKVLQLLS